MNREHSPDGFPRQMPRSGLLALLLALTVSAQADDAGPASPSQLTETRQEAGTAPAQVETLPDSPEPELPWELRPYRILISIGMGKGEHFSSDFSLQLHDSLHRWIEGAFGRYWQPSVEVNHWLFPQLGSSIEDLDSSGLTARFEATDYDKVMVVILEADGLSYQVTGCEWDSATQTRGPTLGQKIVDRRRIGSVTFELLRELFRPLAQIDLAEGTFAELRSRGGELVGPDSPSFPFAEGDLLTGHFRYLDRDRNVRQIQSIPWTYLVVDQLNRSRMTATIQTSFSNPFAGSRRRVELVAIREAPGYDATRLMLTPRTNPGKPLVGVRVRVYGELPSEENPDTQYLDLITDRSGAVTIPVDPHDALRRLIVHSGGAVLSNVPFVPGLQRELTMELPDDSPRLQVEGSLAMVQGDLIDVVSRRIVMLARAVSLARKENFDEADQLIRQVDAQPSVASFESRILAIRVPAVEQAQQNRDRAQEKRIRMMCQDLQQLVQKYLDRQRVNEAKAEISELKKIANS
jgi:hypothetical protein